MYDANRRNFFIRSIAVVAGDIAIGTALASACLWLIDAATLGLFLSFIAWLLTALLALAVSQHVIHPTVQVLLSDRKLDAAVDTIHSLLQSAQHQLQNWRMA